MILDPDNYNVIDFKSKTYAYLSIGEVNSFREYFKLLEENDKLLNKNENWDSYFIKFDSFWKNYILDTLIPDILYSGYKGIMIDTVDSLLHHKIATREEVIDFLKKVKRLYPNLLIMINRGFEIINDSPIDAVLLESTISTHDFETKQYVLHEEAYEIDLKKSLKCYSVDYWHLEDTKIINRIKSVAVSKGYISLVTDIKLQDLP